MLHVDVMSVGFVRDICAIDNRCPIFRAARLSISSGDTITADNSFDIADALLPRGRLTSAKPLNYETSSNSVKMSG